MATKGKRIKKWCVEIIESERGWGQRVDERKYFETRGKADFFVKEYNSHNNEPTVPDWYMYASEPYLTEVLE